MALQHAEEIGCIPHIVRSCIEFSLQKPESSSPFNRDFAEMISCCDVLKGFFRFIKLEYLVHDKVDLFVSIEL